MSVPATIIDLTNLQSISNTLLHLTTGDHGTIQARLSSLARCLGQGLGAQACLIHAVNAHDEQECPCHWQDAPELTPTAMLVDNTALGDWENPLFSLRHYQCPSDIVVRLAHLDANWSPSIPHDTLLLLLNTAAIAYQNLQLTQTNTSQQSIQKVFTHFSQVLKQSTEPNQLLPSTLQYIGQSLQVDRSFILLLKYKNPFNRAALPQARLTTAQQWQSPPWMEHTLPPNHTFWLQDCPACLSAWHQVPQQHRVQGSATDVKATDGDYWLELETFPQTLIVPLLGTPQQPSTVPLVLGFMVLQRHKPWSSMEQTLLDWMSNQLSTALIHNNTLEQVKNLVDTRTAQLKGSLEVQARLYERSRQQVEQLQDLIALKNEFLDSVSHELRTPLTSMKVAMRMLRQTESALTARQEKYLDLLEQEWQREYNLIQNLLRLQKLESSSGLLPFEEFSVAEFIAQLTEPFEQRWQPQGLDLVVNVPTTLTLYSHADSLERIINELLINAGKYAEPNTTVKLLVQPKADEIQFIVYNQGQGIDPELHTQIFEKFFRGREATQQAIAGTGLGLAMIKAMVKHLNGKVEVFSSLATEGQLGETQFVVTLPQAVEADVSS